MKKIQKKKENKPNFAPRKYLSWSQLNLWETDPEAYIRQYIYGETKPVNPAMLLGKRVARCLETRDAEGDPVLEHILTFMQPSEFYEFPILTEIEGVPIYGKLDGFNSEPVIIDEVKTGKKWTQKMVDNFGQLDFYSVLVYASLKVLPKELRLHWAKTITNDEGEIVLTGDIRTFKTYRELKDILPMVARIKRAWEGILAASKEAEGAFK